MMKYAMDQDRAVPKTAEAKNLTKVAFTPAERQRKLGHVIKAPLKPTEIYRGSELKKGGRA